MKEILNDNEQAFLSHNVRWGSDGYPIQKVVRGWIWAEAYGINGSPVVYKTKRACSDAIEKYIDVLVEKKAGRV